MIATSWWLFLEVHMETKSMTMKEAQEFLDNQVKITTRTGIGLACWICAYLPMMLLKQLQSDHIITWEIEKLGIGCMIVMVVLGIAMVLSTQKLNMQNQQIIKNKNQLSDKVKHQLTTYYQNQTKKYAIYTTIGMLLLIGALLCFLSAWLFQLPASAYLKCIWIVMIAIGLVFVSINGTLERFYHQFV